MRFTPSVLTVLAMLAGIVYAEDDVANLPNPLALPFPWGPASMPERQQGARQNQNGPWTRDVVIYRTGADAKVTETHTFERAGVPTIARLKDGRIMAAFQYFPKDDPRHFDRVAVSFSSDEASTWTKPESISVEGMEEGLMRPFDPTLVPLPDGRIRLYYTSNRSFRFEESVPAIYSAISVDGVHYQFEPGVRFAIEGRIVIDCAACLHNGTFHLIVPDNGTPADMRRSEQTGQPPSGGTGYHATSKDGLTFERAADVKLDGNIHWLGNMQSDGKTMTFIGTGGGAPPQSTGQRRGGIWMATSTDGTTWTRMDTPIIPGADPGAVKGTDGLWLVIATSETRR
jgi:hypothetical protein